MSLCRVFLGNLPADTDAAAVRDWLIAEALPFWNVEVVPARNIAFIEVANEIIRDQIIRRFNYAPIGDKLLIAQIARPRPSTKQAGAMDR